MRYLTQTKFNRDDERDNSFAVCLACILDMKVNMVPEFELSNNWDYKLYRFLDVYGFKLYGTISGKKALKYNI